eukprot:scaffold10111_cov17-Tisochrysis_lutea.AAC.1
MGGCKGGAWPTQCRATASEATTYEEPCSNDTRILGVCMCKVEQAGQCNHQCFSHDNGSATRIEAAPQQPSDRTRGHHPKLHCLCGLHTRRVPLPRTQASKSWWAGPAGNVVEEEDGPLSKHTWLRGGALIKREKHLITEELRPLAHGARLPCQARCPCKKLGYPDFAVRKVPLAERKSRAKTYRET